MNHAHHSKATRLRTKVKLGNASSSDRKWLADYEKRVNRSFVRVVEVPTDDARPAPSASSSALHETEPVPVAPPEQFASVPVVGEGDAAAPLAPELEPTPEQKAKAEAAALDEAAEFGALVTVFCGVGLEAALANWGQVAQRLGVGPAVAVVSTEQGRAKALGLVDAAARRLAVKWGLTLAVPFADELLVGGALGLSVFAIKVNAERVARIDGAKNANVAPSEHAAEPARRKVDPHAFDELLGVAA